MDLILTEFENIKQDTRNSNSTLNSEVHGACAISRLIHFCPQPSPIISVKLHLTGKSRLTRVIILRRLRY